MSAVGIFVAVHECLQLMFEGRAPISADEEELRRNVPAFQDGYCRLVDVPIASWLGEIILKLLRLAKCLLICLVPAAADAREEKLTWMSQQTWLCEGQQLNYEVEGNWLGYKLLVNAPLNDDDTVTSGQAGMVFQYEGQQRRGYYKSRSGYAFSNDTNGTGIYVKDFSLAEGDDLTSTTIRWSDGFTLYLTLVANVNANGETEPFHLEGQLQSRAGSVESLTCVVYHG